MEATCSSEEAGYFIGLLGVITHTTELFITTDVRD
jgi:hypothetical protein